MKYLRIATLVGLASALMSLAVNCSEHDVSQLTSAARSPLPDEGMQVATASCVPGQTFQCMGGCGVALTGYQVCAADGRSYGPCMCPPLRVLGPLPSFPNRYDGEIRLFPRGPLVGGLSDEGGAGSAAAGDALVGATCASDADCGGGLNCLTADGPTLTAGGPAGGYCTTGCGNDAACQAIDRGSECIGFAGQNLCVRSCASRTTPTGVSKCLGRDDVMCVSVAALGQVDPQNQPQPGLCLPACQSDAQCGPGLFCDLGNGLCSRTPPAGDPVGSTCDGADTCASGLCLTINANFESFCSGFCRFGGPGCGFDGSQTTQEAACVIAQVPGEGEGDRGFCLEVCQTAADCLAPGAACIPTAAGSLTRVCVVPTAPPPVTPAPDAGVPGEPHIGDSCTRAEDCGAGLVCFTPDSDPFGVGAGFPGGYCSAACAGGSCPEAGATCVTTPAAPDGFCLRACNPQAGDCGGRTGLVCSAFANSPDPTAGFCFPECVTDDDCDTGECDTSTGACVNAGSEPPEPSVGDACSEDSDCSSGTCLSSDSDPFGVGGGLPGGYCSAACGNGSPCAEPGTVCVTVAAGSSLCLRACQPPSGGDCGDRAALTCIPFRADPTRGFCVSECSGGDECGDRVCDTQSDLCVDPPSEECAQDGDCLGDEVCVRPPGVCSAADPECIDDGDCNAGECDLDTLTCVEPPPRECEQDSECADGVCDTELGQCVAAPPGCASDDDCGEQVCDIPQGICVEPLAGCTSNADCGEQVCDPTLSICVPATPECVTDADCAPRVCDTARNVCVDATTCTLDADCDDGVCDQVAALCVDAPAVPIDGACNSDEECVGQVPFCAPWDDVTSACTAFCVVGTPIGCEPYGSDASCVFDLQDPNNPGIGFCGELCDTAADCEPPGSECVDLGGTLNGRTGVCIPG